MDLGKVKAHEKRVSMSGTGASVKISQRILCLLLPCKDTTEVHCLHTGRRSSKALDCWQSQVRLGDMLSSVIFSPTWFLLLIYRHILDATTVNLLTDFHNFYFSPF